MEKGIVKARLKKWILFGIIYISCFGIIEKRVVDFHVIHTALDDRIPFCEYFVIPYLLWFLYVGVTILYFCMLNPSQKESDDFFSCFFMGSAVFFMISLVYPNVQNLRPAYIGEGFWAGLVKLIYLTDTPTNILPSLHVYNSVVCLAAIMRNKSCRKRKWLITGVGILTVSIILSTMLIKQHSVVDVMMALLFNVIFYYVVYRMPENEQYAAWKNRRKKVQQI